ncbi:ribosomal protein S18-alanine N-acetyltransferase [Knoellia sp. 3-2P3]|uniref:ribosomal protein S18-alanine N-acetyltransferase n=1 Tax=unclassified Knoellia TaxID=2618719 RepID=UPI0023DB2B70|nr:ribosomal protein S18-alanine N-acetyltransferase [Knoellia sp. 3-2P3]MDF2093802.1 ribosomal protein S18-alanine N-acetyltransferase [Knoellia sp. 3-2P3]
MVLRELRWTDIGELAALERELFPHDAWSEPTWWSELAGRPRRDYVVEEDAGGIAGYAGLDVGSEVADVMTIAVAPRAQGRGLGRTLLEELVDRARRRGAEYLMLEVRDDNLPARRLYERAGFELLTTRRRYYQPGDVDAHILRLTLGETTSEEETA